MGMKLKFRGTWDSQSNGFRFVESEIRRLCVELPVFNGKELQLEIKVFSPPKTQRQLGYYFSAIIPFVTKLMQDAGYRPITETVVREYLEQRFIRKEFFNDATGEVIEYAGSISELTVEEMGEYIETVNEFCIEYLGAPIPEALKKSQ